MSVAWRYLEQLVRYPHRGSATPQEAEAGRELGGWLANLGYTVTVEPFRTPRDTLYWGPTVVLVGYLAAAAVGLYLSPGAGILLCILLLIPLVGETLGKDRMNLDLFLPKFRSQNVVARLTPPASGRKTLVITAHYDTQRATYLFLPSLARAIPWILNSIYALLVLVPVALGLRWAMPAAPWVHVVLGSLAGLVAVSAVFFVACVLRGRYINGANDNGSGAALLLSLAERFARRPPAGTDLVFVLTGAEEVGCRGMRHYMRTHAHDPATTTFINLDNIGGGILHYLLGEGMLVVRPYSQRLLDAARKLSAEHGGSLRPKPNLQFPTDGLVPMAAGYETITFIAFMEDGSLPNYHWYTDTLANVDRELVEFAEQFLAEYVERLAEVPAVMHA